MLRDDQNCQKLRVRFIKALVDTSEHQSMQHALVSLLYEVVVTVPYRDEDIRLQAHGVYKIEHGKVRTLQVLLISLVADLPSSTICS